MHIGCLPPPWRFVAPIARQHGACAAGVVRCGPLEGRAAAHLARFAADNAHALPYLRDTLSSRLDMRRAVSDRTVQVLICLAFPVGDGARTDPPFDKVAAFARGRDYHRTLKDRLDAVGRAVTAAAPGAATFSLVDTAPLAERYAAAAAGLGAVGRHGLLMVPGWGPGVLLGEVAVCGVPDSWLPPPAEAPSSLHPRCTRCRACVTACPTGALDGSGRLDPDRCLSHWSSCDREPAEAVRAAYTSVYGCDACQRHCPEFRVRATALEPGAFRVPDVDAWDHLSNRRLRAHLADTAMAFAKPAVLKRNARWVRANAAPRPHGGEPR